jgi:hypothetical protein
MSRYLLAFASFGAEILVLIGYAHVFIGDQTLNLQKDALTAAVCVQIYTNANVFSDIKLARPGLKMTP